MILFKIQFPYKEEILEGSVWESETAPKQWHVTIEDDRGLVGIKGVYIFHFNEDKEEYQCSWPSFDGDHSFMSSIFLSLREYLNEHGWNSVNV